MAGSQRNTSDQGISQPRRGSILGAYWLLLVANQDELLPLKGGRFCLRRDPVDYGDVRAAKAAFRE